MLVRLVDFSGAFPANPLKRNGRHDWTRTSDLYRVKANLFNPFNATYITPEELLFKPCFINHLRKPQFLTALTRASRVPYSLCESRKDKAEMYCALPGEVYVHRGKTAVDKSFDSPDENPNV